MTTTIYRNDSTGYTVTFIDVRKGVARVIDSKGYDFAMVGADYEFAGLLAASRAKLNDAIEVPAAPVAQIESPLPAADRRASHLVSPGASLVMPSLPQARCLTRDLVTRGYASVTGQTAPMSVLIAMSRRGWLELDHPVRPGHGYVTDAGRRALAAYVAKNGPVQ